MWICIRDIKIGPKKLYANGGNLREQEVYVTGFSRISVYNVIHEAVSEAIQGGQPIQVEGYQNHSEEEKK